MMKLNWVRVSEPKRVLARGLMLLSTLLFMGSAFASSDPEPVAAATLTDIATNITSIFPSFVELVVAICYVAGIGFAAAGVMKFKQHKDNPTQVPLGGPVAMIFIAAALIYIPTLIQATGQSVFGTGEEGVGSAAGKDPFDSSASGSTGS